MQVTYQSKNGLTATFEGEEKEVFKGLAHFQEIFDHVCVVGKETATDVKFVVRTVDDVEYYELRVVSGPLKGYKFEFGQNKKGGTLFPKRKDKDGNWLENNGWTKWESGK